MTKISISAEFRSRPALQFPFSQGEQFNHDAFLRRRERLNARRENATTVISRPAPHYTEAMLLQDGEALETAWRYEVAALMVMRRLKTAEALAIAAAARSATKTVVQRIEAAKTDTRGGLDVKARAILWRRDGEPLTPDRHEDAAYDDEPADAEWSFDR
jgi:hypothetical protein